MCSPRIFIAQLTFDLTRSVASHAPPHNRPPRLRAASACPQARDNQPPAFPRCRIRTSRHGGWLQPLPPESQPLAGQAPPAIKSQHSSRGTAAPSLEDFLFRNGPVVGSECPDREAAQGIRPRDPALTPPMPRRLWLGDQVVPHRHRVGPQQLGPNLANHTGGVNHIARPISPRDAPPLSGRPRGNDHQRRSQRAQRPRSFANRITEW